MRELHLFAGAGGGILGGMLLGHTCVCAVEIEPYCREVLLQRQRDGILPAFPIWDDVRNFDGKPWRGRVDVVCIGSPCQGFSTSGNMLGLDDERSQLVVESIRIIGDVRPDFILLENTPEIIRSAAGYIIGKLAAMGYHTKSGIMGACDAGMDHMRKRFWMVADSLCERRPEMVRVGFHGNAAVGARKTTHVDSPAQRISRIEERLGESGVLGSNDGLAHRVDRLKAIGNGQIPRVVALAWRTLMSST